MELISNRRCTIGEGPIWNDAEQLLYFTNGMTNEICKLDIYTGKTWARPLDIGVAAIAFDKQNRLIVSRRDGVFILNGDDTIEELYDTSKYHILFANDMKVGPDGRIYVGTQSQKRIGISDSVDGKLYSIDTSGTVKTLLDGLILSNGLEWSVDEKRFYHTDSDTHRIKEYDFDKTTGEISFTGRELCVPGVDGFTIDQKDDLYVACWGKGHIAVVDTKEIQVKEYIKVPAKAPASCAFAGKDMENLIVVTASYHANLSEDTHAGYTFKWASETHGRKPYLFEKSEDIWKR